MLFFTLYFISGVYVCECHALGKGNKILLDVSLSLRKSYCSKGQLISKGLVGIVNSSKTNKNNQFNLQYYDTSGRLVFVRFFEELETQKSPFAIN